MKWKIIVEDYFTFSRPQRRSIILAIGIIIICLSIRFSYHYFFSVKTIQADTAFLQEAGRLTRPDTSQKAYQYTRRNYSNDEDAGYKEPYRNYPSKTDAAKGELFSFDPNTLDADGWRRLGLRDKTINTIQNYISKGGRFRKPDDIKRIYGLFPDQAERLLPYVQIVEVPSGTSATEFVKKEYVKREAYYPSGPAAPPVMIDINTADTAAFISLPGIGSKLAGRIVSFREKLGGFYAVEQIGETYGLPDSVFQKIKSRLITGTTKIKKININTADATMLKTNPYIKWNVANAIVQYRSQHGDYASLDELKRIAIIDEPLLTKLNPYLTIE